MTFVGTTHVHHAANLLRYWMTICSRREYESHSSTTILMVLRSIELYTYNEILLVPISTREKSVIICTHTYSYVIHHVMLYNVMWMVYYLMIYIGLTQLNNMHMTICLHSWHIWICVYVLFYVYLPGLYSTCLYIVQIIWNDLIQYIKCIAIGTHVYRTGMRG